MNESVTISNFVDWVFEGFKNSKIDGELLIVDSSDDLTPDIAYAKGARVLRVPRRGLGDAYKQAVPYVQGRFVILGDADCTYDFRQIDSFVDKFLDGYEFIMGTRLRGKIEPGSMPFLHRNFGTPFTTYLVKKFHKLEFSDIHCGMRGLTKNLMEQLPFDEPGWEYAPEMVIRASQHTDRVAEIPITFLKEPKGRVSHFKRGKLAFTKPIRAGLGSIRVTLMHALDKVLLSLGKFFFFPSLCFISLLSITPIKIESLEFSLNTSLVFFAFGIFGYMLLILGLILRRLYFRKPNSNCIKNVIIDFSSISFILLVYSLFFSSYLVLMYISCGTSISCEFESRIFNSRVLVLLLLLFIVVVLTWIGSIIRSFLDYNRHSKF